MGEEAEGRVTGRVDHERLLENCAEKAPLIIAVEEQVGWPKLWDLIWTLECNTLGGCSLFSRMMSHHGRGNQPCPCPLCDAAPLEISVMDHILADHCKELGLEPGTTTDQLLNRIVDVDLNVNFLANFRNHY